MTSKNIRQTFLQFFKEKEHLIVSSAPMVVKDDPTLMFTNAGMNQFKDVFLGNKNAGSKRVVDTQKCLRVSGKHNDLEEVGVDTYHHTMFEMLGNWSFGDYFKQEAIEWAWELLTKVYKVDSNCIYVTVFGGDAADNLEEDSEAFDIWKKIVPEERIIKAGKKDNFWEMGESGPCGPCSEIHVDLRPENERKKKDGKDLVNADHPQLLEIWNLVFMQYNRMADGSLKNLPSQHVDTGMGFERLCMVLQGKKSSYDTDVFVPLIKKIFDISGQDYEHSDSKKDIAIRVIVDHIRAIVFSIADGQLPSNNGAGYVIKRILRRAVRYGYSFLNFKQPFLYQLVGVLVKEMGEQFPEIQFQQQLIEKIIHEEENSFLRTLDKGIQRFEDFARGNTAKTIPGKFAFELYDTFGFPIDLTQLMAKEKGWKVDMDEFNESLQQQKNRSRTATKIVTGDWVELRKDDVEEFVGYDRTETMVQLTRYREVDLKGKAFFQLVFNITPFYAEGGGQVGDIGYIENKDEKVDIVQTKKENDLIIHFSQKLPTDLYATFNAVVNKKKRDAVAANHSATHLLHHALRKVLGKHVEQKGSLVASDYLRFDFSHFHKLSKAELEDIEKLVNQNIRKDILMEEKRNIPLSEAKDMGATALFGEKYSDLVRVIQFDESIELCGGTHVQSTTQIGSFRIVSESAVAAGVRRIEAITGNEAEKFVSEKLHLLSEIEKSLKKPADPIKAIQDLMEQNSALNKQVEELQREQSKKIKAKLISQIQEVNEIVSIIEKVDLNAEQMRDISFKLKAEFDSLFLVLASASKDGKALLCVLVTEDLVNEKKLHAGKIIGELAKEINGGGGGQAFFATAGGKDIQGIPTALEKAKAILKLQEIS